MKLHEKIVLYRKKNGLSQEGLAEKIGVSRQAVSKWETGEALPEVTKLKALADTFNVTVDFLLDESKAEYIPQNQVHNRSVMDRYIDGVENFADKLIDNLGSLFKKHGWFFGILLIIFGAYKILTCVFSLSTVFKIKSMGATMGTGFAVLVTGFQILLGVAMVVGGVFIIKKFKPKKTDK